MREQLMLGDVIHRPARHRRDHERVEEAPVVGGDDHRTLLGDVLHPLASKPEVDVEERMEQRTHDPVDDRVGALFAGPAMKRFVFHLTLAYPVRRRPLQFAVLSPGIDRTRTLSGAVCGAVAAVVWGLQQPLHKLVFGSPYDDIELLGKAVTRGPAWYSIGFALHI